MQIALRAQTILLADEGVGVREIMRRLGTPGQHRAALAQTLADAYS